MLPQEFYQNPILTKLTTYPFSYISVLYKNTTNKELDICTFDEIMIVIKNINHPINEKLIADETQFITLMEEIIKLTVIKIEMIKLRNDYDNVKLMFLNKFNIRVNDVLPPSQPYSQPRYHQQDYSNVRIFQTNNTKDVPE